MQPDGQNQYGFIFDQGQQKRFTPQVGGGKNKILISVIFVVVVLLVVILGFTFISSLGKADNSDLVTANAYQTEINRVIELGKKDTSDINVRNNIATLQVSIQSDAKALEDLLAKRKTKISKEQAASKKDSETDSSLESATQAGNHDEAFQKIIDTLLNDYYATLKDAKNASTSKSETELLGQAMTNLETYAGSSSATE